MIIIMITQLLIVYILNMVYLALTARVSLSSSQSQIYLHSLRFQKLFIQLPPIHKAIFQNPLLFHPHLLLHPT